MTSEVKLLNLQKQVDDLKRKLRDSTQDKVQAINRNNQDWERKLASQVSIALKRSQAEHDTQIASLQADIDLRVDREIATATSGKDAEIRKIKDSIDNDKGTAVKLACFKTEDKYSEIIKQIEGEFKAREAALTREIFHLSGDREEVNNQLALLKQADLEKAAIIKNLNFEHEKSVKELIEVSKQDQLKEYTKFKAIEKYAQDKESEVKRLEGKIDILKVDKEILEKQLKKRQSTPDTSPSVPRIMRYTERERELTKKIRDLEDKVKTLHRGSSSLSNYSLDTISSPYSYTESTASPTRSISSDSGEKPSQLKRQVKELKEQVIMLEDKCYALQQKSNIPERDSFTKENIEVEYLERELQLKEKYHKEIEVLENEVRELRHKIRDLSVNTSISGSTIDDMQTIIDGYDARYKKLCKDSIMNQQAYSLWCETDAVKNLRNDLQDKIEETEELKSQNNSLQIKCDNFKEEYSSVLSQNNQLIEEREIAISEKNAVETELKVLQETMNTKAERIEELEINDSELVFLREKNESFKLEQESYSLIIEKQNKEIDLLKSYESEANDCKVLQESCEQLREKIIHEQTKEKELMVIIQTLEDQNSYLQSELQSKDDKLSDLTSVISNLTDKLKVQKSSEMNEVNRREGHDILFYPPMYKNNRNNNNNDDEMNFEAIESPITTVQKIELDTELYKSEEAYNSEAPLSLSTADQLSTDSTNSSDAQDEIFPLSAVGETDQLIPDQTYLLEDVSIDEWSHASEEEVIYTPKPPDVSPIPTPDKASKNSTPDLFLIRYNYDPLVSSPNPHPEQELSLKAGDCVYIYGIPDQDGFYLGELNGGKRGLVPSNFVEKMPYPGFQNDRNLDVPQKNIPPTPPTVEDRGTVGPLDLYTQGTSDQLLHTYTSNLSNIVEEDESLLDNSNLTRISGNISSTESIDRCQTEDNSSTESLDKITDIQTPVASPRHIPQTADLRVKYTDNDVELSWTVPPNMLDTIQGYHVSIGSEITQYIEGARNTFLSMNSLEDKLNPGRYTLVICTVTNYGYSDPVECTIDTTLLNPPYELRVVEDGACVLISWSSPDTFSLSSPLVSFTVYLNDTILTSVDFSDFLVSKGVSIPRVDLLKFYESSPDQQMSLTVKSFLSDGRFSCPSEILDLPLQFLTRFESTSGSMTVESESSEGCSRHSTSSESEVLEVFRRSSIESDQLLKARQNTSDVVSKPPLDRHTQLIQSTGSKQRQSFTPNEENLFTELEAQGEPDFSQEMFALQQNSSQSDSDDDKALYAEIPPLDVTVTYYVALYDYNPVDQSPNRGEYQSELPLKKGEVIAIFGGIDNEGFFTGQVDTKVGLIPYNLIEKINLCDVSGETSSALLFQATKQAFPSRNFTALYSYNPRTDSPNCDDVDDELSFKSGTSISIFGDVQDDGFFIGERDGQLGFVPSNFIEPVDHIKPQDTKQSTNESTNTKGATHPQGEIPKSNKNILAKTKGIFKSLSKKS
ncbi:RIMS-binding protein 2 isoform X2 [Oopsacas minuta]|uniref:RIMS-binding protein 2 isoform X2 n=1 Tax=Oopsacas minuta TaxID=111878 RepID=A0AAV7KMD8_9METZ|nr:RIMS-binding protein 2 isoform X2 [Oopsacas minuta]